MDERFGDPVGLHTRPPGNDQRRAQPTFPGKELVAVEWRGDGAGPTRPNTGESSLAAQTIDLAGVVHFQP
ncbi:hypothetical protein D3C84_503700 [compost metagenome]